MRQHICAPPHRNAVPMKSHSDGQRAGYFPRTLSMDNAPSAGI
jgi:hypothetical protein